MGKHLLVEIEGAVVMAEAEVDYIEELIKLPKPNPEYKYLSYTDQGVPIASKDTDTWAFAISVVEKGERKMASDCLIEHIEGIIDCYKSYISKLRPALKKLKHFNDFEEDNNA